ncbi:hypothetical protein DFJ63DRAFT_316012 [Scheffersomyces coipomensis]|uniref:uncharacterized protein n=1 Tax=Scheffersomyces coipomensis TaxID=1788519 RepID=UPI00315D9506
MVAPINSEKQSDFSVTPPKPFVGTYIVLVVLVAHSVIGYRKYGVGSIGIGMLYAMFTLSYIIDQWPYISDKWDNASVASLGNVRLVVNQNLLLWIVGTISATTYAFDIQVLQQDDIQKSRVAIAVALSIIPIAIINQRR